MEHSSCGNGQATVPAATSRLSMVTRVTDHLAKTLDFKTALRGLVHGAVDLLGAEQGALLLIDRTTRTLSIHEAKGISDEQVERTRISWGQGVVGTVAENLKPVVVNKSAGATVPAGSLHPELCLPLAIHGTVLGVLCFGGKKTGASFEQSDLHFSLLIAQQVAMALYTSMLHDEYQENLKAQRRAMAADDLSAAAA